MLERNQSWPKSKLLDQFMTNNQEISNKLKITDPFNNPRYLDKKCFLHYTLIKKKFHTHVIISN